MTDFIRGATAVVALVTAAACAPRVASLPATATPRTHRDTPTVLSPAGNANGPWEQRPHRAISRPDRSVRYATRGSSELPGFELVRDGEVIARVTAAWSTSPAGKVTRVRQLTLYRDGAVARVIPLPPDATPLRGQSGAAGSTPQVLAVGMNVAREGLLARRSPCEAQLEAMYDAIDRYFAADAVLDGCLAYGCLGAAISFIDSWRGLIAAESNLGACLGAI